jgi:hypothetical protein
MLDGRTGRACKALYSDGRSGSGGHCLCGECSTTDDLDGNSDGGGDRHDNPDRNCDGAHDDIASADGDDLPNA